MGLTHQALGSLAYVASYRPVRDSLRKKKIQYLRDNIRGHLQVFILVYTCAHVPKYINTHRKIMKFSRPKERSLKVGMAIS